uniref:C1q domain-containing protein n=1 Tax=Magallana gigas TaxID=29159 RepID=A0A8W8JFU0_MAGGI
MNISKSRCDVSTRIGFTATVSSSSSNWNSGTLVFPVVITNLGNGYDPNDGVFTAPTAGTYVFFVNIISYSTKTVSVKIILNGGKKIDSLAQSENSNAYNSGSNLVVLPLQKADRVWVSYNYGSGYYGSYTTANADPVFSRDPVMVF